MPEITILYTGILAVLFAVLSTRVAMLRGSTNVALGHGTAANLFLAQRRFGNLAEYGAMAVVVLLLLELSGVDAYWLHLYGGALVVFRLLHPFVLFDTMDAPLWKKAGRFVAAAGTAALLLVGGVVLVMTAVGA